MRIKAFVLCFTCLLFSSLALAQGKPSGVPDKAYMQKILDAWASMNTETVAKYYDHAPSDVFYDVAPVKYNGWAEYAAGVKQLSGTLNSIKFTANDDAAVHRAGNLIWGTVTVKTVMTDKAGKTTNLDCRWTIVWEKRGANWVIVHDHFSAPLPEPK